MAKPKAFSSELKETVLTNNHIHEVHFNIKGEHFLNAHKHDGKLYGHVHETKILKENIPVTVRVPNIATLISDTCSREEVLSGNEKKESSLITA